MRISYSLKAGAEFENLPAQIRVQVAKKMAMYSEQEDPLKFAKRIVGTDLYRFRIGDYRLLFSTVSDTIFVITIQRRDKVYLHLT